VSVPAFSPVIEDPQLTKAVSDLEQVRGGWAAELTKLDKYMRGQQEISYMSDAMRKEFGDAITDLVLNFPELVVEAHGDRLDVEGFRFPGETSGNDALWGVWQANNMDERSVMGHTDALGLTKAAVIVGAGDDPDLPVITVESAMDCSWIRSPATGAVTSALKRWAESDGSQWASLYVPGSTRTVTLDRGTWRVTSKDDHGLDRVPLVPLINRPRIKYRDGRSEFASVIPIADAANKMATDMMVSGEYHAMPRRWVFGLKRSDFVGSAFSFAHSRPLIDDQAAFGDPSDPTKSLRLRPKTHRRGMAWYSPDTIMSVAILLAASAIGMTDANSLRPSRYLIRGRLIRGTNGTRSRPWSSLLVTRQVPRSRVTVRVVPGTYRLAHCEPSDSAQRFNADVTAPVAGDLIHEQSIADSTVMTGRSVSSPAPTMTAAFVRPSASVCPMTDRSSMLLACQTPHSASFPDVSPGNRKPSTSSRSP
jgi:hypothetical protein